MRYSTTMTVRVTLDFPDDAFSALRKHPRDFASEIKEAAVCKWFELGLVSQGRAAELLSVTREQLFDVLARHRVTPFQVTATELREELARG